MEHAETIEGYEAVPLTLPDQACLLGSGAAVQRPAPQPRGHVRALPRDSFAPEDLVGW